MKVISVGGGPAGLYAGILLKKAFPEVDFTVYERNHPDDTFGWGVVFSKETLGNLETADAISYQQIRDRFIYWDDIEVYYRGECVTSTGHGFCGLSRRTLLQILRERAEALGVRCHFQKDIPSLAQVPPADLIIAADGVHSSIRQELAEFVHPRVDVRKCKFSWLGTTLPLKAFTFVFKQTPYGVFQVHAYPFDAGTSTWIVECREEVWKKAGLDKASEQDTVAFCERLFADELRGHKLLSNKSIWRSFPTVTLERWHHQNVVLLGDAAHTAHFSIGSGTKLALEDAMALVGAFQKCGTSQIPQALEAYEADRRIEVLKLQRAAQTSLEWFENSARYFHQPPLQFAFNLMTRSKRITHANLAERDPKLVQAVNAWFAAAQSEARTGQPERSEAGAIAPDSPRRDTRDRNVRGEETRPASPAPQPAFAPFQLRSLKLNNRIVVSPMCQYSAEEGTVSDWHLVHLGSRAIGGAGMLITEMTDVSAEGRITHGCAGLYKPEHMEAWKRIVQFVHGNSQARIGIQLAHAGRKGSCERPWEGDKPLKSRTWQTMGPSAIPYRQDWPAPKAMDAADFERVKGEFTRAARWSQEAGFDLIELHAAHGYLLSSFLSPLSNGRTDHHGGTLENRARFLLEIFDAVRAVWPAEKPMAVRLSATDWLEPDGMTVDDAVQVSKWLKARGCDLIDVSSSGNVPESKPQYGRMYQVPFADRIRAEAKIPVMAVGAIQGFDHANTVVAAGRADLCALARAHLLDPYLTLRAAAEAKHDAQAWPSQYLAVKPKSPGA